MLQQLYRDIPIINIIINIVIIINYCSNYTDSLWFFAEAHWTAHSSPGSWKQAEFHFTTSHHGIRWRFTSAFRKVAWCLVENNGSLPPGLWLKSLPSIGGTTCVWSYLLSSTKRRLRSLVTQRQTSTKFFVIILAGIFLHHSSFFILSLRHTFSTRPLTNTHDWPAASASEATALRRYTNLIIIIILLLLLFIVFVGYCGCRFVILCSALPNVATR